MSSSSTSTTLSYPQVAAALDLNFAADTYVLGQATYNGISNFIAAAGGSFSRSSTATYFDSTGTLQTAAANTPRLNHDPATGSAKGLLIEESSTNLLLYSSNFAMTAWSVKTPITMTANAAMAPDGTMTATELSANGSGLSYMDQVTGSVASTTVTRSIFVMPGSATHIYMEFGDATNCGAYCTAGFDLLTQTASWNSPKTGEGTVSLQKLANGWFRASATYSHSAAGSASAVFYVGAYGAGTGSVYVWGAQVEIKPFSTSYIPTGAATVTRSADVFSFPIGTWFNSNTGAFFTTSNGQLNSNQIGFGCVIGGDGGRCFSGFAANLNSMNSATNSFALTLDGSVTASPSTAVNMAMTWNQSSTTESLAMSSGQLFSGNYSGNWVTTNLYPGGSNLNPLNASVSRITYYPAVLTNASLTTWAQ